MHYAQVRKNVRRGVERPKEHMTKSSLSKDRGAAAVGPGGGGGGINWGVDTQEY